MLTAYLPFSLVLPLVQESLDSARHYLQRFQNEQRLACLVECERVLHHAYGALHMVECYGPALLLEECEALLAMMLNTEQVEEAAIRAIQSALIRLPLYLELLENGSEDRPSILLTLVNDCRKVRGVELVTQQELFIPNMQDVLAFTYEGADLTFYESILPHLICSFDKSLLNLMMGLEVKTALESLRSICQSCYQETTGTLFGQLWWLSLVLADVLLYEDTPINAEIKQFFADLRKQLKLWTTQKESLLEQPYPAELRSVSLQLIQKGKLRNKCVKEVFNLFGLQDDCPITEILTDNKINPLSHGIVIIEYLESELGQIYDVLQNYVEKGQRQLMLLYAIDERFKRVVTILKLLGLKACLDVIEVQLADLQRFINQTDEISLLTLSNVATRVLYAKSLIKNPVVRQPAMMVKKSAYDELLCILDLLDDVDKHMGQSGILSVHNAIQKVNENLKSIAEARAEAVLSGCLHVLDIMLKNMISPTREDILPLRVALVGLLNYLESDINSETISFAIS